MKNIKTFTQWLNESGNNNRSLKNSVPYKELYEALTKWYDEVGKEHDCVLIGGLAVSYHGRPRNTQDVDFLTTNVKKPEVVVDSFKKIGKFTYIDKKSHAPVEAITPEILNNDLTDSLVKIIQKDAVIDKQSGVKIASINSLIVLKLLSGRMRDDSDVVSLLIACNFNYDIKKYKLKKKYIDKLETLVLVAAQENKNDIREY